MSSRSKSGILDIDGEVRFLEQVEEVHMSNGKAYIGPPAKHTSTYVEAGEVGMFASQSSVLKDVSDLA